MSFLSINSNPFFPAQTSPPSQPQAPYTPNSNTTYQFTATNVQSPTIPSPISGNNLSTSQDMMSQYEDGFDQGEAKRRRIAKACDLCRKKKIRCNGTYPSCSHCLNSKSHCIFTQGEKKRAPPKGAKYIENLENRLDRMESLLRLSGILREDDDAATDLNTLENRLAEKAAQAVNGTTPTRSTSGTVTEQSCESSVETGRAIPQEPALETSTELATASTKTATATTTKAAAAAAAVAKSPPRRPSAIPAGAKKKFKSKVKPEEDVEALSEAMCSLVTNNCGDTRYIGSASGFSIFSPKGIKWINEKTGDTAFQDMVVSATLEDNKLIQWRQDIFGDIFARKVYCPLPPKAEAISLLQDFFLHFNHMFPLFHETQFMMYFEKHYSSSPPEGSGWWASLNIALAISHRMRVMSKVCPAEEDLKAWGYLKNALACQTELTMRNTDLFSIQALLGISMFLMGTPNPQPSFFLVAAAIRLAHSLGLHKKATALTGMNPFEAEQRRRVFWLAYMLDKDVCLRSGRPPVQDDNDMNIELPEENPPDNIGNIPLADGVGKVNMFRLMCVFATISSKVYKNLYSVTASRQSDGELLNAIGELDKELEEWKEGIPIDFRPEREIKASHTPLMLHVVVLHFAYYNCLTTIHRMSVHHGYWTSRLSNYAIQGLNVRPLNPRVFSSAKLCVTAARASINLIKYIPQGDFDCVWMLLYFPVSAHVTLFANILQNPQDSRARCDLKLMNQVVEFLSMLCDDEGNTGVCRIRDICAEFERISRVVLDKSDRESSSVRRKRKQVDPDFPPSQTGAASVIRGQTGQMPTSDIPNVYSPGSEVMGQLNYQSSPTAALISQHAQSQGQPFLSPQSSASPTFGSSPIMNAVAANSSVSYAYGVHTPNSLTNAPTAGMEFAGLGLDPYVYGQSFQHPFVPQDLWQMSMTLDWDWADMTNPNLDLNADLYSSLPPDHM